MNAKKTMEVVAFAVFLAVLAGAASARVVDGIVAVVNDEPVTFSEFRESVAEGLGIPEGDADIYLREEKDRGRVLRGLEALIEAILVRQELTKMGQPVTDADVGRAVESVRKTNNLSEAEFRETLEREGINLSGYRRRIRWQMERGSVVRAKKLREVTVTEEEIRIFFRENAERFLVGAEVRLETLFLPFPPGEGEAEGGVGVRIAAQQASDHVRSGMPFAKAADMLASAVPGISVVSSDYVKTDDLLPEIGREVHRLKAGETSPPIFAEEGIHLVRVLERRGGTLPEFSSVKGSLMEELVDRRSERAFAEILVELKQAATIDIRL